MAQAWIKLVADEAGNVFDDGAGMMDGADLLVSTCLAAAANGDAHALFDLGVAYSTGGHGVAVDMVEAHKWFNLASVGGHDDAAQCRADVADEMTAREISEAQRRAREWIRASSRRAA